MSGVEGAELTGGIRKHSKLSFPWMAVQLLFAVFVQDASSMFCYASSVLAPLA